MIWAVGVYTERNGKNEVKIIESLSETRAMQKAVDGYFDVDNTTIDALKNHYWETRQIVVSNPVFLRY
jgi:hypothetical protein